MAAYFEADKYFFASKLNRFLRHPYFIFKTFFLLIKVKPRILFVQNPSLILGLFVSFLKQFGLFNYKLIVDCHNEGVEPFYCICRVFNFLYKYIQKISDINIVTNSNLARIVEKNGGRAFVLPDRIPLARKCDNIVLKGDFNYLLVCTFAKDEPVSIFFEACKFLCESDFVYVTGDYKKWGKANRYMNANIVFTGYLTEEDYWNYLYSVDCVVDLTLMDYCIVCGAYEALSLGKPMLLSDTAMLRATFPQGAVFAKNDIGSLTESLLEIKKRIKTLEGESGVFKKTFSKEWEHKASLLKKELMSID